MIDVTFWSQNDHRWLTFKSVRKHDELLHELSLYTNSSILAPPCTIMPLRYA